MENKEKTIGEWTTPGRKRTASSEDSDDATIEGWNPGRSIGSQETLQGMGISEEWKTDGNLIWKRGEVILGRYVVERELGKGGMGEVYECLDTVAGVKVALKCLPAELNHNSAEMEEVRENFELVYKLSHPNIASAKTLDRDARGEYFLVMEVAEGESLRKWIRRKWKSGRVSLAEAIPILRQVAAALDYAHGKKVVHRDVKPGNVVIDGTGEVKVLDFGLAAQIWTSLSRASRAYRGTSGTGPYMAPEQWEGQPQDGKTDQYALGVMAYEMLSGRLPFANSELAVLREAVLHGTVRNIPGVGKRVMAALRRAMAKRAEERFASCGEFVAALAGPREGKGTLGRWLGWGFPLICALAVGAWMWREKQEGTFAVVSPAPREEAQEAAASGDVVLPPEDEAETRETEIRLAAEKAAADKAVREEQERLAAEIAAEKESERLEEERIKAEREERIRQENEVLEETVYRLAPMAKAKAENAERMGYDRGQGFGARLDGMKEKLGQGEAAMSGRNFAKAKEYFEASMAAAAWLEINAPLRASAGRTRDAAALAKGKADAMDGERLEASNYKQGRERAAEAEKSFGGADFRRAMEGWNEAVAAYAAAEKSARAKKVREGLETARKAMREEAWETVVAAAKGVLALDAGNAEGRRLKDAAEKQLRPILLLNATVNGKAVKATVTEGLAKNGLKTPVRVGVQGGETYSFALEYEAGGKRYSGSVTLEAKARGRTEATVALEEDVAGRTKSITLPGGAAMEMVWCPPGRFTMGSPENEAGRDDDETQHEVKLTEGFWMAKYPVTQKQWRSVMETTLQQQRDKGNPSWGIYGEGAEYPIYYVTWEDAEAFCRKANLQLPTEAQWEYACRADSTGPYAGAGELDTMGWYEGNSERLTCPVGGKKPNAWGLHDMHGNVWEWCSDRYEKELGAQAVTNPPGPASGEKRVLRGGSSWGSAQDCRSAYRDGESPGYRGWDVGFRPLALRGHANGL